MARVSKKNREQAIRNSKLITWMVGLLLICAAFAAGFAIRGNNAILDRLGFETETSSSAQNPGMTVSGSTYDSVAARVAEMQGVLEESSMDTFELDGATDLLLSALSDATSDPFVRYYNSERYANYLKDVSENYAGVGVLFGEVNGKVYVVDVFAGSEAEGKDVRVGDFVVAIDGDRGNDGWTQAETVKSVSRAEGESVVLTFRRPATIDADGGPEYTVTLTCTEYDEPNVTTEVVEEVGYIKLSQITQNADELVSQAVQDVVSQGSRSIVLDLRNNPGGYLTQSVDVASLFIKSGVVVEIQTKDGLTTRSVDGGVVTELPLVVIVNENTAGTAEVIAGALQDNSRAVILGVPTMGKGSVQSMKELSFGGALRYTSAHYKTPKGYDINEAGINPDVAIGDTASEDGDTQKTLALEHARNLAGSAQG